MSDEDTEHASPAVAQSKRRSAAKHTYKWHARVWRDNKRARERLDNSRESDEESSSDASGDGVAPFASDAFDNEGAATPTLGATLSPGVPRVTARSKMSECHTDADAEDSEGDGTFMPSSARQASVRPPQRRPLRRHKNYPTMFVRRLANTAPRHRSMCSVGACARDGAVWCDTCQQVMCNA